MEPGRERLSLMRDTMMRLVAPSLAMLSLLLLAPAQCASAQESGVAAKVTALKRSLQENKVRMQRYQWIETTTVNFKGDPKSQKQNRCYYGVDGVVQKVPVSATPEQAPGRGLRGRIVQKKKEEMTDYMQQAADVVHMYIPPSPDLVEKAKAAGGVSFRPLQGSQVAVEIRNYLKPGDLLTIDMDAAANRIVGITVASFVEGKDDPVNLVVQFATLPDGTSYAATSTLNAPAKSIQVVVQNSGFTPAR
jgi:hypothetical protein